MTKFQLMDSLLNKKVIQFVPHDRASWQAFEGIVYMMEREDGSGKTWSVRAFDQKVGYRMIFVRTID